MAKMFYTLEEAAERLGVDVEQVRELAAEGKLQQFRDRDKLMFKREQVESLAQEQGGAADAGSAEDSAVPLKPSDSGDTDQIALAGESAIELDSDASEASDKASSSGASESGSGSGQQTSKEDSREATGISVFDASEVGGADPMAQTQMTENIDDQDLALESVGSGSGLLDLTRESDDTSLGAELLDEIYPPGDTSAGSGAVSASSGVFEGVLPGDTASGAAGLDEESAAPAGAGYDMMVATEAEPYDPAGSYMSFGFLLGALVALLLVMITGLATFMGVPIQLTATLAGEPGASSLLIYAFAILALSAIMGVAGYFIGKAAQST